MAKPAAAPTAGPIQPPPPRCPPRHWPAWRRYCTFSTAAGAVELWSANEFESGAAVAEPPSIGAPAAITAAARIVEGIFMVESPFLANMGRHSPHPRFRF